MRKSKRFVAGLLAVACCFSVVGCGKDGDGKKTTTTAFVGKEDIKVTTPAPSDENDPDALTITGIPDGAEKELEWLSYFDINPAKGSAEKRADLQLFEAYGGKIKWNRAAPLNKYDKLAEAVLAGKYPDMFWFEQKMSFPCNVVQGMFQPIDELVDFDNALWSDVKDASETFAINGKHYVAPISFEVQSVLTYDQKNIDTYGLEDPYQLYLEGEWDWNAFEDIMREWVAQGDEENIYYGVNGWLHSHIFHSTGKSLIEYDAEKQEYYSNVDDADLERAANYLYNLSKDNIILTEWKGQASDAFQSNVLFYSMGVWASIDTHTPQEDDDWRVVPIPKDPNSDEYYMSVSPVAYMWVKGSEKADAMKCWLECARIVYVQDEYKQAQKDKFFLNNPNFNEDAYTLVYDELISDKFNRVYDVGYGISTDLSNDDAAANASKEAIISYMYSSVSKADEETGTQFSWAQLKGAYEGTIDSELKTFNAAFKEFLANN
ncbi:MAG: ABC transporter substrate-binding protein [Oscillospiraceae bacterium]|nr:ABC transporter substrate-binding protein [Oscillospiraceae bacterium]